MTEIPPDDILENLYMLRLRESEKLKIVLELSDLEIHQKKVGLDYHRLKTMVIRSIEQNLRMKTFEARNGNHEKNDEAKNQETNQRVQRIVGDCWQWETNGQCSKGDNCSFRHDMKKRAKSKQPNPSPNSSTKQIVKNASRTRSPRGRSPSGRMARLPITSKELASIHSVKKGTLQGACSTRQWVAANLVRSAFMRIARFKNSRLQGPKRMMTRVQKAYGTLLSTLTKVTKDRRDLMRIVLPISAAPTASKIWGSVSGSYGMVRVRCLRSSVEVGQT